MMLSAYVSGMTYIYIIRHDNHYNLWGSVQVASDGVFVMPFFLSEHTYRIHHDSHYYHYHPWGSVQVRSDGVFVMPVFK